MSEEVGSMHRSLFPADFTFGTATAAYQVEGAAKEGGRGPSTWDIFSHTPGKTFGGHTGDVACDQYHRFQEDIALMVDMGVSAYRFSLSWPRILPTGHGTPNPEGIDYYNRLIDALIENGITPYVTLFHWDLPQALQDDFGGWLSPKIIPCFLHYASVCFAAFGDRVSHWITFNEPLCYSFCSFSLGIHAPGREGGGGEGGGGGGEGQERQGDSMREPYLVVHHILLCHAKAVRLFRKEHAREGFVFGVAADAEWVEPLTAGAADVAAAERRMQFQLGWILDPLFFGDYPSIMREMVGERLPVFSSEESEELRGTLDFVGVNNYTTRYGSHREEAAEGGREGGGGGAVVRTISEDQRVDTTAFLNGEPIGPRAASEWLYVVPWGIRKLLLWISKRFDHPTIIITENGMDDEDDPSKPLELCLQDDMRVNYYKSYLHNIHLAIGEGAKVKGYFAWSLLDNFEWAMGYSKRFGLHYVDYNDNLKRYPKASARWWKEFLSDKSHNSQ